MHHQNTQFREALGGSGPSSVLAREKCEAGRMSGVFEGLKNLQEVKSYHELAG